MAKDRVNPCIYYVCYGADCQKGIKNVDMSKCKNCSKYRGRKNNHKQESIKTKRQKDKDRHDRYDG
jgi:sulfur relay (sulfurtransferase) complex TusBCD TusD component (DsrE family)